MISSKKKWDISNRAGKGNKQPPNFSWDLPPILVHLLLREAKGSGFWSHGSGRRQQEQVVPQKWSCWKKSLVTKTWFGDIYTYITRELWDKRPSLSSAKSSGLLYFDHQQYQTDTMLIPWCHAYHGHRFTFLKQENLLTQAQKKNSTKKHPLTVPKPLTLPAHKMFAYLFW